MVFVQNMDVYHYPSKLLENAVNEFSKLPGIGKKTALRLVLYLLKRDLSQAEVFGNAIVQLRREIRFCRECWNISDSDICSICANPSRDHGLVCVVENIRDVMAIEHTFQFKGVYHVLGGIISPIDGIGPGDLSIDALEKKAASGNLREVILALSATMEGDTTNFFIYRKICGYPVKISAIARGVAIGGELEFTDDITLGRSIINRMPFQPSFTG